MKLLVSECVWDAVITRLGFSSDSSGKESACSAGDAGLISGSGRSPGEGDGNPLQYSCLGNPMDRGAWQATVHGVEKSQTRLSNWTHTMTRWPPKFSPCNLRCGLSVRPGWWPGSRPTGSQEEREGASPASGWHSFAVASRTVIIGAVTDVNTVTWLTAGKLSADWCISFFSHSILAEPGTIQKLHHQHLEIFCAFGKNEHGLVYCKFLMSNYWWWISHFRWQRRSGWKASLEQLLLIVINPWCSLL